MPVVAFVPYNHTGCLGTLGILTPGPHQYVRILSHISFVGVIISRLVGRVSSTQRISKARTIQPPEHAFPIDVMRMSHRHFRQQMQVTIRLPRAKYNVSCDKSARLHHKELWIAVSVHDESLTLHRTSPQRSHQLRFPVIVFSFE